MRVFRERTVGISRNLKTKRTFATLGQSRLQFRRGKQKTNNLERNSLCQVKKLPVDTLMEK